PKWLDQLTNVPGAFRFTHLETGRTQARFDWKPRSEWLSGKASWPPPGVSAVLTFEAPQSLDGIVIEVHYELYDGLPLITKWFTLQNRSQRSVTLNSFTSEILAAVEPESIVDGSAANFRGAYRGLDVFSDYAFGGNMTANADAPAVHWTNDPPYLTQVHYERQTPCLLECAPAIGPEEKIPPGRSFESFRVFELVQDSTDRERRGLATRRAYRALAPWTQENPVLMHVRSAQPDAVRLAVDQCAEVGFEMVILTFWSGFDIENEKPEYLAQLKELADYARSKHIALGGYSLLASRSIDADDDVINPITGKTGGARFGNSPCLCSRWGEDYFRK
ncbi:MAG: alpha-galactosidase, partial [Limisphaerales bacterium]